MMRTKQKQTSRVKYVPQRTCLACRKISSKQELVRLVRISDGSVEVDAAGKRAGRGAYLCPTHECWEIGLKGRRLEHTLRTNIAQDNRDQLARYGKSLEERPTNLEGAN